MLLTADKKLATLTIVVVVGFGALSWWCYQLYEADVAQSEVLDVQRTLSREVERLGSRVASSTTR